MGLGAVRQKITRQVTRIWSPVDHILRRQAARWHFLAGIYYGFFNGSFRREHRSTLAGWQKYQSHLEGAKDSSPMLRRNTHRLEKGMLMRPRRDVFALGFIEETVSAFEKCMPETSCKDALLSEELLWAYDVLGEYFRIVAAHPVIDEARVRFEACVERLPARKPDLIPYHRQLPEGLPVAYEAMAKLAQHRRSVRWFLQKPVPRELLDKAVLIAAQSPSACNRQPFYFRFFDDPELCQKVAAIPGGTGGYAANVPVFAVVVGQMRNYFEERDRHLIYVDASLAAMAFVFGAETLGLSTCVVNWPDIEHPERSMAAALKLEPDERPIMCLAIGFPDPDGLVANSTKKPLSQLRYYN